MKQHGFTLVELLVGLAVAMLCMVMMLTLFAQITRIGGQAARDADYDAQLETGLLIAQKLIQNAGYGVNPTKVATPSIIDYQTDKATYNGQPAIVWRERLDLDPAQERYNCFALTETITASGNKYIHRLNLLSKDGGSCGTAALPTTVPATWTKQNIVKIETQDGSATMRIFNFVKGGGCNPFNTQNISGGAKVTLTGTRLNVASGKANTITRAVCLRNIP